MLMYIKFESTGDEILIFIIYLSMSIAISIAIGSDL